MVVPYSAIQFAVYAQVQRWVKHALNPPESALFSGAVAGIVATLFTYPMDLVRTCQAASSQRVLSTKEVVSHAVSSRSLYRGSLVTILGIIPYAAMQFSVYEQAKHWFGHSSQALLISGILAGVCGKIANMPFDVIKKRMQIEGILYSSGHSRIWQFSKSILEKEGIMAFFKGTAPSVIKAAPNSAITFFVYERVMDLLEQI
jgi:solute carrier family 25 thiamine pyrophosphate transporter 19